MTIIAQSEIVDDFSQFGIRAFTTTRASGTFGLASNEPTRAVMERWLRRASQRAAFARLEEETASYYDAMSSEERDEDAG